MLRHRAGRDHGVAHAPRRERSQPGFHHNPARSVGERRSGYAFAVTPITTRWDALIEETGGYNQEWDGIWYAQARRNDEGWVAEIAIPFKSLNFPEGRNNWGFNISRGIARYNQFGRWAFPLQHAGADLHWDFRTA